MLSLTATANRTPPTLAGSPAADQSAALCMRNSCPGLRCSAGEAPHLFVRRLPEGPRPSSGAPHHRLPALLSPLSVLRGRIAASARQAGKPAAVPAPSGELPPSPALPAALRS